jgi:asparagine synthetase B (glutamine-hydrolysing)
VQRFVVVASGGTPTIDERTIRLLRDPTAAALPFDPHEHVHWRSGNGLVHVASWSAHELFPAATRTVDGGIVVVGGLPIVTQPTDEIAFLRPEEVARHRASLDGLTARLDGPYALVALGPEGRGTAVNDPFGLHPLYLGEFGPSTVLANDAAIVAAVLASLSGRAPEPDEDAVSWILLNGQMFGDETPYRSVRRLPFGSGAAVGPDGEMTVVPVHEPPWQHLDAPGVALDRGIEAAEQRMIATILAASAATPGAVVSELTAGRDSRLVLGLVARAGVADRVLFRTYGPRDGPDRIVAAEIARHLGLAHEAGMWPIRPGGPTIENFVAHVRQMSAQIPCWEMSAPRTEPGIVFSGLTGESLRTNYPRTVGLTTVEGAEAAFARHRFGRYHYVREGVLDELQRRSQQLFRAPLDSGAAPEDLFDIFYVQHRLRRWIGDKPDRFVRYVFPLYSPSTVRLVMAQGWEYRAQGAFHDQIARRAQLSIEDISFEQGSRWRDTEPPAASAPRPESAPQAVSAAGAAEGEPTPAFTRTEIIEMRQRSIREAIEFDGSNPAFELVDREAMLADTDDYAALDRRHQIELHQALTVVLWLGLARPGRGTVTR